MIMSWMNWASKQLPRPWATATVPSIDIQASLINRAAFAKLRELISPSPAVQSAAPHDHVDCSFGHPSVALEAVSGNERPAKIYLQVRNRHGINARAADEADRTNRCAAERWSFVKLEPWRNL